MTTGTTSDLPETASQTAGPYLQIGLAPNAADVPMFGGADPGTSPPGDAAEGHRITLTLRIFDGAGAPVTDALVETWQADAAGHIPSRDPAFTGWARASADAAGLIRVRTLKPGATPGQAPHVSLWIAARGIGLALQTRVYFDGDPGHDTDPLLTQIDPPRRATLMARPDGDTWHLDLHLQGPRETVFLDI